MQGSSPRELRPSPASKVPKRSPTSSKRRKKRNQTRRADAFPPGADATEPAPLPSLLILSSDPKSLPSNACRVATSLGRSASKGRTKTEDIMASLKGKKIAILATDGFEQSELLEPRKALEAVGATTVVVAPKGGSIRGWKTKEWGDTAKVDETLDKA